MNQPLRTVRGMHDVMQNAWHQKHLLLQHFRASCLAYGFQGIETPCVEMQGVFSRTAETSDIVMKEMFELKRRSTEKEKAADKESAVIKETHPFDTAVLRPEGTAPVMRAVLQHGLPAMPLKLFYEGPMFRYDRPQKGRLRQFHQVGIESLGSSDVWSDIEALQLSWHFLGTLGLQKHVVLRLNTLGDLESRLNYTKALVAFLQPHANALSADSQRRLQTNPLRVIDSKDPSDKKIVANAPSITDHLTKEAHTRFQKLAQALSDQDIPFLCDPTIVRGLDYYTQTTFEFTANDLGASGTVLAGGRYDGLSEKLGGPSLPGIGWAAGVERLLLLQEITNQNDSLTLFKGALIPFEDQDVPLALQLSASWRQANWPLTLLTHPAPLGKRLKKAVSIGCTHALMIGENERNSNTVTVKNFKTGAQETVPVTEMESFLENCARQLLECPATETIS